MVDDLIEGDQQQYNLDHIPTLFVATKSDLDLAQQVSDQAEKSPLLTDDQRHEVQPDVYCRRLGLQVPVAVSVKKNQMADVFHVICGIAIRPCVLASRIRPSVMTDLTSFTAPPPYRAAQNVG